MTVNKQIPKFIVRFGVSAARENLGARERIMEEPAQFQVPLATNDLCLLSERYKPFEGQDQFGLTWTKKGASYMAMLNKYSICMSFKKKSWLQFLASWTR